jgi:hypothetical protein
MCMNLLLNRNSGEVSSAAAVVTSALAEWELSNSMDLNPSSEAASCAVTQELPNILWNPKVHYRVHKSPPLAPILSQINPIHITPSYLRSILILATCVRLGLPSGLFPSGFPTKILYAFLYPCYMPCPSHPPWLSWKAAKTSLPSFRLCNY